MATTAKKLTTPKGAAVKAGKPKARRPDAKPKAPAKAAAPHPLAPGEVRYATPTLSDTSALDAVPRYDLPPPLDLRQKKKP